VWAECSVFVLEQLVRMVTTGFRTSLFAIFAAEAEPVVVSSFEGRTWGNDYTWYA